MLYIVHLLLWHLKLLLALWVASAYKPASLVYIFQTNLNYNVTSGMIFLSSINIKEKIYTTLTFLNNNFLHYSLLLRKCKQTCGKTINIISMGTEKQFFQTYLYYLKLK